MIDEALRPRRARQPTSFATSSAASSPPRSPAAGSVPVWSRSSPTSPSPSTLDVTAPRLPAEVETTAYFIVAEALTNVVKHAAASRASVRLAVTGEQLVIEVRDDGSGGADPARGTGLTGLSDRVEVSDGTLAITSPPGRGTMLRATLPVDNPGAAG